ncbi:MAG: hypothetical protein AB8G96_07115, partial [Phycisphaerales bacterium]
MCTPPRPSRLILVASCLLGLLFGGCGDAGLLGSGPIRGVVVDEDGTVWVHRSFSGRNADVAVLLTVDGATGAAAPILPRLPGEGSNTITAVDLMVDRPGDEGELLLAGESFGAGTMRGPYRFRGVLPTLEPLVEGPIHLPSGGPSTALSPDGRHLVVFRAGPRQSGRQRWQTVVIDVASGTADEPAPPVAGRQITWLGQNVARLDLGPRDAPADASKPGDAGPRMLLLGAAMPADGTATAARIVRPDAAPGAIDAGDDPFPSPTRFVDLHGGSWSWSDAPPELSYRAPGVGPGAAATATLPLEAPLLGLTGRPAGQPTPPAQAVPPAAPTAGEPDVSSAAGPASAPARDAPILL